ncbi:MAG: MrtP family glutamic-type intramembrane protease [Myxococcota bacterium]|nr:MrtP family glutamic-type intramembrane protease [Myxococcota bacterium]
MTTPTAPSRPRLRRELILVYLATLLVTGGMAWLQGSVGWLRGYLVVAAAAVFIFLPMELLYRQGVDPKDLGIRWDNVPKALHNVAFVSLLVFPIYLVGFHVWQTQWLESELKVSEARFDHWPVGVQDRPRLTRPDEGQVWVYAQRDTFWIHWVFQRDQTFTATISSDEPLIPKVGRARIVDGQLEYDKGASGHLKFEAPGSRVTFDLNSSGERIKPENIKFGTTLTTEDDHPVTFDRSFWWFVNLIFVQMLLVALPEELFYRGYLQSRLDELVGRDVKILGVACNPVSILLTSALFAVGHIVTVPSVQRLAVFFPSLLFGWMRRATGGILAPLIFHAACNLIVTIASQFYRAGA